MTPRVVVFARWPRPGAAKTRLIPALGPEGAAELHARLVERTLTAVRGSGLPFELRTTGATPADFQDWLGVPTVYDQGEGPLGERLERASPPYPCIFIGADAPDLTAAHLRDAASALAKAPVVIGPAEDGGYWLLGLAHRIEGVFTDIDWGTDRVFAQTMTRLSGACVSPELMPMLADLDRPEDLTRWPELAA